MKYTELTIESARQGMADKLFTAVELLRESEVRIKATESDLKAFLTLTPDEAVSALGSGAGGELAGIPAAIKDVLMTKDIRTTAASKILDNYVASYDATAVFRLKSQGLVLMGKTNCDEFAMGGSTENSGYYPTLNPWDLTRVPGGSSGGSAAAVAAGQVLYAIGSDTGGSIRQPAAFCGVVGLKPTYGLVSRYGLIAMASSLDSIGPFTRTVKDAAIVLNHLAGADPHDATTSGRKPIDYVRELAGDVKGMTVGLPREYFVEGLDSGVREVIEEQIKILTAYGVKLKEVSLPHTQFALPVYYILMPAEVSSNLAKFDGLRYGQPAKGKFKTLLDYYQETRGEGFGAEVRRRVLVGTYVLSAGYVDEYYLQAQKVRTKLIEDFKRVFTEVDLLLTPTTPTTAFRLGEKMDDPVSMYLADIYTVSVNLAGLPALSVPAGLSEGLPVGMQLIGPRFSEGKIMRLAHVYEQLRGPFPRAPFH